MDFRELLSYRYNPFKDGLTEDDKKVTLDILKAVHEDFIEHVEAHRKKKITLDDAKRREIIYNADVFNGKRAVELG